MCLVSNYVISLLRGSMSRKDGMETHYSPCRNGGCHDHLSSSTKIADLIRCTHLCASRTTTLFPR